ncbi:GGDEF domain-containing protein [Vibrio sp. LaRot3]|uniref:GGDEF domain-containing protein n=1 Tax=Vibrio sp. LaRot3 TaxID=2998829 RepID=UPI0022CDE557|nr:GGDEF domain-containing protein [Vibrio sp. LaRot3]MDA0147492.1 diguanylate cyclase [Vibrio sp. LaRot3]
MKRQLAKLLSLSSLLLAFNTAAQTERALWEETYANALKDDEVRALSLLQDRYNALQPGIEKLYISGKLHGFMTLHGQPFYGTAINFDQNYSALEERFVSALNSEEKLDFLPARKNYLALLQYADNMDSLDGKILFEYHLCRLLNRQAQYLQANTYCSSLNTHIRDAKNPVLPKHMALRVIANNQEFIGNYPASLATYQELLSIIPHYEDSSGIYNDAGLLLSTLGNYDQAKEYISHALKIRSDNMSPLKLAQSHHSMGKILLAEKEYELAITHFMQSKLIVKKYNHLYGQTYAELGLGNAHIALKQYEQGNKYLLSALESATKQENAQLMGEIYLTLSDAYQIQNNYDTAEKYALEVQNLAQSIGSERLKSQGLKELAEIAEAKGEFNKALDYYREYSHAELIKRNKENNNAFVALDTARRSYLTQLEISNLTAEKDSLTQQLLKAEKYNEHYLLAIALLILLQGFFFHYRRVEKAKVEQCELTGALNRAASIREIKRQSALNNPDYKHVILLLDLDDFKSINDAYGHPTGDRALRHVTKIIKSQLSNGDILGRLGGEEFVVLLKEVDELDIRERVERMHQAIANTMFKAENRKSLTVTASFSFLATSRALSDFDELYSILDQALYQAKQNGKNCIIDAYNEPIYLSTSAYVPVQPSPAND